MTKRPLLSVALIVRDEEAVLDRGLQSLYYHAPHKKTSELVPIWDELVIVDTGSVDSTVAIAESHGAKIGHFDWINDMAAARNYAESLCTGEWIYMQDADEVLIEGHQYIRATVEGTTEAQGIQPLMIFDRDDNGKPSRVYHRQALFHRNDGKWHWEGAAHEDTVGPAKMPTDSIVVEHHPKADKQPHPGILDALRQNLGKTFDERHTYYLAREHWYKGHYQEAIALVDSILSLSPVWPIQRSGLAIIKGDCYRALEMPAEARAAYIRAIQEWGAWAEPYYSLGSLHYELRQWAEGAAWFYASLPFDPPDWFTDNTIYDWRRYDLLAVCLSQMGRKAEARPYGVKALSVRPNDKRLQENMAYYTDGLGGRSE
jgi:tetratricopeptide (TPR) repeat protein